MYLLYQNLCTKDVRHRVTSVPPYISACVWYIIFVQRNWEMVLCCTRCASCFVLVCVCVHARARVCAHACVHACTCTHAHVQANWLSSEGRCPCCTDLDIRGLLWIPLQLSRPSTCTSVGSSNLCCCWALWGGWLQADGLQGSVAVGLKQCCVPVASVPTKM